ncbi:MAG: DUF4249 family protein [Candidatus Limimorpha sp.]
MKRNICIVALLSLLLMSCTEKMIIETQEGEQLIGISGSITDEYKYQEIIISRTAEFYSEGEPEMVSGAKVLVHDNIDTIWFAESEKRGHYLSTHKVAGKPEHTYNLFVELSDEDGNKKYHAQSTMRRNVDQIDSISIKQYSMGELVFNDFLGIYPFFQTIKDKDVYYMAKIGINDRIVGGDTLTECEIFSMEGMAGIYFNGPFMTMLAGDMAVYALNQNDSLEVIHKGDTVSLYLWVIPTEYAFYISDALSSNGSNPMLGTPSNVPSNIYPTDNSVGFFHASSVRKCSTIY